MQASTSVWSKLCFEYDGTSVWLRTTRSGRTWAFHASTDGTRWRLVGFSLGADEPARVGFLAQSPNGQGCRAVCHEIAFSPGAPADLRDET